MSKLSTVNTPEAHNKKDNFFKKFSFLLFASGVLTIDNLDIYIKYFNEHTIRIFI